MYSVTLAVMARKPINQHRMLTAASRGQVIRVTSARWCGSWQIWDETLGRWRSVDSGETKALDTICATSSPMIEEFEKDTESYRTTFRLTEYGEITLVLWNAEFGPVADPAQRAS